VPTYFFPSLARGGLAADLLKTFAVAGDAFGFSFFGFFFSRLLRICPLAMWASLSRRRPSHVPAAAGADLLSAAVRTQPANAKGGRSRPFDPTCSLAQQE
jgi:hypothetical protein